MCYNTKHLEMSRCGKKVLLYKGQSCGYVYPTLIQKRALDRIFSREEDKEGSPNWNGQNINVFISHFGISQSFLCYGASVDCRSNERIGIENCAYHETIGIQICNSQRRGGICREEMKIIKSVISTQTTTHVGMGQTSSAGCGILDPSSFCLSCAAFHCNSNENPKVNIY